MMVPWHDSSKANITGSLQTMVENWQIFALSVRGWKKSSPSVWRWKMTESVRGWKNARSGTSGFHVRPNPQMTPQTRPCLCVALIIVFLCFDNSISLGVPFVFAAFIIALLSVLSQYISLCPRPKEEGNDRPDNGSMATTWQFKLFSGWLICRETDDLAHLH